MSKVQDSFTIVVVDPDEDYLGWADKHLTAPDVEIQTFVDPSKALPFCLKQAPDLTIAEMGYSEPC